MEKLKQQNQRVWESVLGREDDRSPLANYFFGLLRFLNLIPKEPPKGPLTPGLT